MENRVPKAQPEGFIPYIANKIIATENSSPNWAVMNATQLLTTMSSRFRVSSKMGDLALNSFMLNIGPTGLGRKSAAIKYYTTPIIYTLNPNLLTPPPSSTEAMTEWFSKKDENQVHYINNVGLIIHHEFSQLFKNMKKKDYASDLLEQFSMMYDGIPMKRFTRKTGLEDVPGVFMNVLGCSTEYLFSDDVLDKVTFLQGTGNRFVYLYEDYIPPNNGHESSNDGNSPRVSDDVREIVGQLKAYENRVKITAENFNHDEQGEGTIWMDMPKGDKARKLCNLYIRSEWEESCRRYRENHLDLLGQYLVRQDVKVLKFAGVHCLSRNFEKIREGSWDEILIGDSQPLVVINENDVLWAIKMSNMFKESFKRIITNWRTATVDKGVPVETSMWDAVKQVMANNYGVCSIEMVMNARQCGYSTAYRALSNMKTAGIIEEVPSQDIPLEFRSKGQGQPKTFYRLKDKGVRAAGS
jgi:hypothetical protein